MFAKQSVVSEGWLVPIVLLLLLQWFYLYCFQNCFSLHFSRVGVCWVYGFIIPTKCEYSFPTSMPSKKKKMFPIQTHPTKDLCVQLLWMHVCLIPFASTHIWALLNWWNISLDKDQGHGSYIWSSPDASKSCHMIILLKLCSKQNKIKMAVRRTLKIPPVLLLLRHYVTNGPSEILERLPTIFFKGVFH